MGHGSGRSSADSGRAERGGAGGTSCGRRRSAVIGRGNTDLARGCAGEGCAVSLHRDGGEHRSGLGPDRADLDHFWIKVHFLPKRMMMISC